MLASIVCGSFVVRGGVVPQTLSQLRVAGVASQGVTIPSSVLAPGLPGAGDPDLSGVTASHSWISGRMGSRDSAFASEQASQRQGWAWFVLCGRGVCPGQLLDPAYAVARLDFEFSAALAGIAASRRHHQSSRTRSRGPPGTARGAGGRSAGSRFWHQCECPCYRGLPGGGAPTVFVEREGAFDVWLGQCKWSGQVCQPECPRSGTQSGVRSVWRPGLARREGAFTSTTLCLSMCVQVQCGKGSPHGEPDAVACDERALTLGSQPGEPLVWTCFQGPVERGFFGCLQSSPRSSVLGSGTLLAQSSRRAGAGFWNGWPLTASGEACAMAPKGHRPWKLATRRGGARAEHTVRHPGRLW